MLITTAAYPKIAQCRYDFTVVIKPLDQKGVDPLLAMLRELTSDQQALLPCDVASEDFPAKLLEEIKSDSVIRLAAWHGDEQIVGSLAMFPGGNRWTRHTAQVITVVHPEFRRMGVAHALLEEVLALAEDYGIQKVYCELTDLHTEACQLIKEVGFRREARLENHMLDDEGALHPLGIFSMDVAEASLQLTKRMFRYVRMDNGD